MIEPWELLLHHSYSGTPGVIFDDSPKRRNHGRAVGLNPADSQADGLSSGSGAIRFHNNGMVRVVPSEVWDGLSVVRCEIVCWCDAGGGGVLVDGGSFKFWLLDGAPSFQYELANTGSGKAFGPVSSDGTPPVPLNQWVTMSFFFDGIIGNSSYSLGSTPLTQFDSGQPAPLAATNKIVVGNGLDGRDPFRGLIDDIKIWRLDPKWVDKTFTHRPVDPRVRDCWDKWSDGLGKALAADTECAVQVATLIRNAVNSLIRKAASPATKATWEAAVETYRKHWEGGDLNGVADALNSVIAAIGTDLQLTTDPAIVALMRDPCVQRLIGHVPSLDCDPQFTGIWAKTAKTAEALS